MPRCSIVTLSTMKSAASAQALISAMECRRIAPGRPECELKARAMNSTWYYAPSREAEPRFRQHQTFCHTAEVPCLDGERHVIVNGGYCGMGATAGSKKRRECVIGQKAQSERTNSRSRLRLTSREHSHEAFRP